MKNAIAVFCCCAVWTIAAPRACATPPSLNKGPLKVTGLAFAFSGNIVAELQQGGEKKLVTFARNFGMENEPPPDPGKINVSLREDRPDSGTRWLPQNAKQTKLLVRLLGERLSISTDELERLRIKTIQHWLRDRDNLLPKRHEGKKFGITWVGDH